jgi:hypothetical protein
MIAMAGQPGNLRFIGENRDEEAREKTPSLRGFFAAELDSRIEGKLWSWFQASLVRASPQSTVERHPPPAATSSHRKGCITPYDHQVRPPAGLDPHNPHIDIRKSA